MKIDNSYNLQNEKKRISFLFTSSIFVIIVFLEFSFLGYKFFDYKTTEFVRLLSQSDAISRIALDYPNFESMIVGWNNIFWWDIRPPIMFWNPLQRWRIGDKKMRIQNFFFYNKNSWDILFSPIKDDDFYKEILNIIYKNNTKYNGFNYNNQEYFFINKWINNRIALISFVESRLTVSDILKELLEYISLAILLAILIYFLTYKFVSRTLQPVEENINDMEQFIFNAGHELKTPISVIKSYLQLAKLKKNYDEASSESLIELDKMNNLIQSLISLSTIRWNIDKQSININNLIKDLIKNFENQIEEKNISVQIIENSNLILDTNKEYFEIFFNNFFTNAIKYNKKNWKIVITIDKNSLEIKDTWKWINSENLKKIFDRFYQESESREENSSGIWLSIVKRIADIFDWKITVKSQKWVETKFLIKF